MTGQDNSIGAQICAAIQAQKLGETAAALAARSSSLSIDDAHLLDAAQGVCQRIRQQMIVQANDLVWRLQQASIPCHFDASDPELTAPQYHRFGLSLEVENPTQAVEILKGLGFWLPLSTGGLYWESFRRNHSEITLTRIDDASTRLDLRWLERPSRTPWRPGPKFLLRNPVRVVQTALRRLGQYIKPPVVSDKPSLGDLLSTPQSLLPQLLSFAGVTRNDVLVDIGCGDGRVLIEAARRTGCRCVGFESQGELCRIANASVRRARLADRVKIHHGDAWSAALSDATVVFLFVPVQALATYLPPLLNQLTLGSRVVAHEQVALECSPEPDQSTALICEAAITVAHLWRVS